MKTSQRTSTPVTDDMKSTPHIRSYPGNVLGKDYIIGDIHGSLEELEEVLSKLGEQDRLFIAGDLNDKGPHSQKVVERIMQFNRDNGERIIVTCGNHEKIAIELYDAFKQNKDAEKAYEQAKEYSKALGQQWLIDLIESTDPSDQAALEEVIAYYKSLPFIIHVTGTNTTQPFLMVHADLPFENQQELLKDLNRVLSDDEINHCIWARRKDCFKLYKEKTTDLMTSVVYCGHSILEGIRLPGFYINLDIGTYYQQAVLMVNHTDQRVDIVSKNEFSSDDKYAITELAYQIPILLKLVTNFHAQDLIHEKILYEYRYHQADADYLLFEKKWKVLAEIVNALKETVGVIFNRKLKRNPTSVDLARNIHQVIFKHIQTVMQEFKTPEYQKFDTELNKLIASHIANNDYCYLEYSDYQIWRVDEVGRIKQHDLRSLPFEQVANIIKQVLIDTPIEKWSKFEYLLTLVDSREKITAFVELCANGECRIPAPLLFNHFIASTPVKIRPSMTYYVVEKKPAFGCLVSDKGELIDIEKLSAKKACELIQHILKGIMPNGWRYLDVILNHFIDRQSNSPIINKVKNLFNRMQQEKIADSVCKLFYEFCIRLIECFTPEEQENELKKFILDEFLKKDHDTKTIIMLKEFIRAEYGMSFPEIMDVTISTLSLLPTDANFKFLWGDLKDKLKHIGVMFKVDYPSYAQSTFKNSYFDLINLALIQLQNLKFKLQDQRFFSKTREIKTIRQIRGVLADHGIFVPEDFHPARVRDFVDFDKFVSSEVLLSRVTEN